LLFEDPRPHVERKPSLDFHLGIVDKDTQKSIGDIWIFDIENKRMAKVGYRLSPKFWGRGVATEALSSIVRLCFETTELQRLWAEVHTENLASVRVLEKCGFIREGCIRQGKMISVFCDYYIYGLLRKDYENISDR
jgi:ribosomal-protein-alanine N-acetyltransferase